MDVVKFRLSTVNISGCNSRQKSTNAVGRLDFVSEKNELLTIAICGATYVINFTIH